LPNIFTKFEIVQEELELNDEADHSEDRIHFEAQYYLVEAKFHEILHKAHAPADNASEHGSGSTHSTQLKLLQSTFN
jgi:hypothetical protein